MSAAVSHPSFIAGFIGGALAAATYTAIAVVIYRLAKAQRRGDPIEQPRLRSPRSIR